MEFHKYQGTGNDFILIDDREGVFPVSKGLIAGWCHRRFGIGADGLILLRNCADADFRMVYFNSDGRESTMCGNGGRCIARFAHGLGIAGGEGTFMAIDGLHRFEVCPDGAVRLGMSDVAAPDSDGKGLILNTGSPHYVIFRDDVDDLDLVGEARQVRYNDLYRKEGINVNFVSPEQPCRIRTYERGVEAETYSCGTGAVAAAMAIAAGHPDASSPLELDTMGGMLKVHFQRGEEGFRDVWLEGAADPVFKGVMEV